MKWNIKVVYRIVYTIMTMICIGGMLHNAFYNRQQAEKMLEKWKDASGLIQLCWLFAGLLAVGMIFAILYFCNGYRLVKLIIAAGAGGYIGYCFVQGSEVAKIIIIIALVMILQGVLEYIVKDAIYTYPLLVMFGIVLAVCPAKSEPLQWTFVEQLYNKAKVFINDVYARINYYTDKNDAVAGFSSKPSFSGGISDNDMEQLCLIGNIEETGMYVVGGVYNTYTEKGWRNNITPEKYNENGWNYIQLLTFLKNEGVDEEQAKKLCKTRTYKVVYKNIYTDAAFTFLYSVNYKSEKKVKYEYYNSSAVFDKPKKKGFEYEITYIDINYGSDVLQNMWENIDTTYQKVYSYEELCRYSTECFKVDLTKVIGENEYNDIGQDRAQMLAENYLEVPEQVPDRVRELAIEITRNCDSDYEKMSAIADYLREFAYNQHPADMTGDCVIDSFLFDVQEGYCTYFASAMVLLCRCVDIPARYVSGFYLGEDSKSTANTYVARGNNAHAWAECYIDGYGFVTMEATPGYSAASTQEWHVEEPVSNETDNIKESQVPPDNQGLDNAQADEKEQDLEQATEQDQTQEHNESTMLPVFVATGLIILGILLLVITIRGLFCYRKYIALDYAKQCGYLLRLHLKLLAKSGMAKQSGETLREYGERMQIEGLSDCIAMYEKIKYGQAVCEKNEKDMFYNRLMQRKKQTRRGNVCLLWYFIS